MAQATVEHERSLSSWVHRLRSEEGSQVIEFIGVLPLVMLLVMIVWQFILAGGTELVAMNAAMEGAHALAIRDGGAQAHQAAVNSSLGLMPHPVPAGAIQLCSAPGQPQSSIPLAPCSGGSSVNEVACTVRLAIPTIRFPWFQLPAIYAKSRVVMRKLW